MHQSSVGGSTLRTFKTREFGFNTKLFGTSTRKNSWCLGYFLGNNKWVQDNSVLHDSMTAFHCINKGRSSRSLKPSAVGSPTSSSHISTISAKGGQHPGWCSVQKHSLFGGVAPMSSDICPLGIQRNLVADWPVCFQTQCPSSLFLSRLKHSCRGPGCFHSAMATVKQCISVSSSGDYCPQILPTDSLIYGQSSSCSSLLAISAMVQSADAVVP